MTDRLGLGVWVWDQGEYLWTGGQWCWRMMVFCKRERGSWWEWKKSCPIWGRKLSSESVCHYHNTPCSDTEYQHYTTKMQQWLNNWKKKLWKHLKANNNQDKKLFLSRVLEEKAGISWNCREMVIGPRAIGGIWQGYGQVGGRGPGPCLNWNWK